MFYTYVLRSLRTGRLYVGHTDDLEKRLARHNDGESRYTKNRGPFEVAYSEEYSTRSEAMRREKFLKSGKGREFVKQQLSERESAPR